MKVLIIGSGGREHALALALRASSKVSHLYAFPGSDALSELASLVPKEKSDFESLKNWALEEEIDLTVVGPELPLTEGIVDVFENAGLKIFGPSKKAARLEASKVFAKEFFHRYKIPTAEYGIFNCVDAALQFLEEHQNKRWVVKVDGLAAGKGVLIGRTIQDNIANVKRVMENKEFGEAGSKIVIEEFLEGEEASFMVVCDGKNALPLATSQDHKRLLECDEGPNTGGMGAYCPAPVVTPSLSSEVMETIIQPTLRGMQKEGSPFKGVLYAGLMIQGGKPLVLEFNIRFGDPEAQVILPRLKSDFADLCLASAQGCLDKINLEWTKRVAACVVLAAENYPESPVKGDVITGLDGSFEEGVFVYHAGTKKEEGKWLTHGGRVLTVTTLGDGLKEALDKNYRSVEKIKFRGMQFRKDIGHRALRRCV